MKIRISFIFIILVVFFIVTVFYKSLFENKNYVPKNINYKIENISIKDFYTGNNKKLKSLFGEKKLIAINIWASWCLPCRKEHQHVKNLSTIDNLKLIGLNYKDKKNNAQEFLEELGNPFDTILIDTDGTKAIFFGAYGVPETIILDRELKIIKKYIGPLSAESVKEIKTFNQ
tara:strand:- start:2854 stop:3372 length:519 start_codon:yes stop_codon:yes gene_type:complete